MPTTATLWGDTFCRDGFPMSPVSVEVLHADTGELVATTVSSDWSIGEPIEGNPCSGRPDGDATLAGMVDGDPDTATEFSAERYDNVDVGDITLDP